MNLKTLIFIFFSLVLIATLATGQTTPYNKLDKLKVNDLIAGKLEVQSTSKSSLPCPSMTQVQRDAIVSPQDGSCVYNNDTNVLNIYNGTEWVEVGSGGGGGGGIANWETAKFYEVGDVVIESNKIYQCNTQHTSSVFATDIANWTKLVAPISLTTEVSGVLPMANGGTDKALTPELGGIVYTDGGSMEVLGAGSLGQLLKSNGAAAPEWTTLSVDDATFSGVLSLGKGGTNKNLTASNGAIAYSDTDSIELLAPGTAGQILQSNGVGAPSYVNKSISGKNENGSSVTLEEIQVSNNQLTQTDVNKHLLESGNSNILANPSFEHSTVSTSWTSSAGTLAEDLSVVVNGKKSLSVNLSTQALALTQDSTLYAAQFADGVQGLASIRVKTSLSGIRVCSRQAGVTSTTNCVNVQGNGKWGLYKVPMILGATSNGISIHSNGTSLTGTVYLDDAFVGAVDLQATVDASKLAGESYFAFGGSYTTTSFASASGSRSPTIVLQNEGSWQTASLAGYQQTVNSLPPGCYSYTWTFGANGSNIGATQRFAAAVNGVTQTGTETYFTQGSSMGSGVSVKGSHCITTAQNITYELRGASTVGSVGINQGVINFNLLKFSSGTTYSSTNADTDWASCGHTAASFTGFGTVSAIETQCKRQGGDLLMKGKFTAGTNTAVEARVALPIWNGVQLVSAGTSIIPSLQVAGSLASSYFSPTYFHYMSLIEPSVSYMTMGIQISNASSLTKANGNGVAGTNGQVSFNARIPIEGWQQSNLIIGQFSGLEKCTNTLECTDVFSAKISATGVTSEENVDFLSGNCSLATNVYTCTFNASIFTVAPNCVISPLELSAINGTMGMINSQSSSSLVYKTVRHDSAALAAPVNLICQKQGVDYVGKTAKAVSSDQNLRTPGVSNAVINSCKINNNGTATIDSSSGLCSSWISSVSRTSIGNVSINLLPNTFSNNPICTLTTHTNGNVIPQRIQTASTSNILAVFITPNTAALTDSDFNITCHGIKP
jgi:hypothetical protein